MSITFEDIIQTVLNEVKLREQVMLEIRKSL